MEPNVKCCKVAFIHSCIILFYFIYFILFGPLEIIPMVFKKILLLFMLITVVLLNIFETLINFFTRII